MKLLKALLLVFSMMFVIMPLQANETIYTFSVVPQQSASKTAKIWGPILKYLGQKTGYRFKLKTAKNIPVFEQRLLNAESDFSYMNPYHYTVFHEKSGYNAVAKAKDKRIHGIIVVRKDSNIKTIDELDSKTLAFPSPAAFAASILPRRYFSQQGIKIMPKYVSSHDSVYRNVAKGFMVAGGGVVRTFKNASPEVFEQLRVLWKTDGYTPHAVAAHARVSKKVVDDVQAALGSMNDNKVGMALLKNMKVKGFEKAVNSDWDDVRALKIDELK